jgi:uncharacterized protein (TIGR02099 family)
MAPDDSPSSGQTGTTRGAAAAALDRVELAVEDVVERAATAAQRTATRHLGHRFVAAFGWILKAIALLLLIVYFAFGFIYLGTRYWLMPHIDEYRPRIEAVASQVLGTKVLVDRIETDWRGINPHLRLLNVRVFDTGDQVALALPQLEATLSWTSVATFEPRFTAIAVRAPELEIRRLPGNKFAVAGFLLDLDAPASKGGLLDWVLAQRHIAIRDLRLRYSDETNTATDGSVVPTQALQFEEGDLEYRRGLLTHRLAVRARPPSDLAGKLELRMEFRNPPLARLSEYRRWTGRIFAQSDYADLARLLQMLHLPTSSFELRQAQGAVRGWLQFDQMHIERLTADIALANVEVQLARDHAPLLLAGVQGRFTQRKLDGAWQGGQELAFSKFSLVATDGLAIPETDLNLRVAPFEGIFEIADANDAQARRGEFTASRVRIESLIQLAQHAPILRTVRDELEARNLHGQLFDTQLTWQRATDAPLRYSIQTRFSGLGSRGREADPLTTRTGIPRPGLPGFENLSGTLTANEIGGKVQVEAEDAALEFPGVFETARVAASKVKAAVGWATQPHLELRFDSVSLSNPELDLTGSGSYRATGKGPGVLDVTGRIARLAAPSAHLYAPLVLGAGVRAWLRTAFTNGEAVDGSVRLRGDLGEFPFASGSGEFLALAHVRGVDLDYLSPDLLASDPSAKTRWPAASNVEGDLRVERNKLQFIGQRASVFDTRLERIEVRVPELVARDPHLLVGFGASGPAADVLRFVEKSPVGGWLGNFLAETRAEGPAQTEIHLDVPLKESHSTHVTGAVTLGGGDVSLMPDLPTFYNAAGRIEFSESSFKIPRMTAGFVGGQINLDGGTRAEGQIVVAGNGTATAAGVRQLTDIAVVHRALDRAQGAARYTGTLTVRGGRQELHVESNLAGWSLDLPAPMQKSATDEWPSRFDIVPQAEAGAVRGDRVRLFIANKLALQVARRTERGASPQMRGGIVRVGRGGDADVEAVPERGLRIVLDLPRLDVDQWTPFFTAGSSPGAGERGGPAAAAAGMPDLIAARIDELVYSGKTIANVVLGATRAAEGDDVLWLANMVSDNATGSVNWRMPRGDSPGRVSARLARLLIPESNRSQVTEVLDAPPKDAPAFDVVVDSFELGEYKLGRLELVAQNTGVGNDAQWQLQRLEISNPDARMHATGRWYHEPGAQKRTVALDLALEFNNGGRLLERFGIANALRGGEGTLEGQVSWRGTPLSIDYPSLAGTLRLVSAKGQFLKADAGAGRLLGILSLQALPRRMAFDFRDVFSEGFAFDSITATANIAGGVLSTRDFRMRSANATVLIEGASDLRAESQNLHILVLPEVSVTSASLVYALLANPAIGLGTFIAQLLLRDPLSKAFSFEYDVTGSWRDPVVKRRERVPSGNAANDVGPQQEPQQPR